MANSWTGAWLQLQSLLNSINHMFIFLMAAYFTVLAYSLDFEGTAMHMFMAGIGYHVLMAEALMSHYPINPVTNRLSHRNKSRFHGLLQLSGGSMALLGALVKFSQKEVHFNTLHGKFGVVASFFCIASLLGGFVNYFQPKFALKIFSPSEIRYRHNLFGLLPFTMGMATMILGYYSPFFLKYVSHELIPVVILVTVLVYLLTMIAPASALLKKLKYRRRKSAAAASAAK